ncbi:Uncharacterised protein [Mycobacteroides abscessus]|nr:Uncharacterised protein [Mycobacteroides abscessus]
MPPGGTSAYSTACHAVGTTTGPYWACGTRRYWACPPGTWP